MFETIVISLLGVAYVKACIDEAKEEKKKKENRQKLKVLCYAIRHSMMYNEVVELIENGKLTLEDINNEKE